jgi:hypothetical protein
MTVSDATHSRTWGVDGLKGWRNRCHPVRRRYQALIRVHCARSNRLERRSATPTSAREGGDPESQVPLNRSILVKARALATSSLEESEILTGTDPNRNGHRSYNLSLSLFRESQPFVVTASNDR